MWRFLQRLKPDPDALHKAQAVLRSYYGNRQQYWKRHDRILRKFAAADEEGQ